MSAKDWVLEAWLPNEPAAGFVLDVSLLDGPAILAAMAGTFVLDKSRLDGLDKLHPIPAPPSSWHPLIADATSIVATAGVRSDSIALPPDPGALDATLKNIVDLPSRGLTFGTFLRLRADDTSVWCGAIETSSASYDVEDDAWYTTISAVDLVALAGNVTRYGATRQPTTMLDRLDQLRESLPPSWKAPNQTIDANSELGAPHGYDTHAWPAHPLNSSGATITLTNAEGSLADHLSWFWLATASTWAHPQWVDDPLPTAVEVARNLALNPCAVADGAPGFATSSAALTVTRGATIPALPYSEPDTLPTIGAKSVPASSTGRLLLSLSNIDCLTGTTAARPRRSVGAWFWVNSAGYGAAVGAASDDPANWTPIDAQTWTWITSDIRPVEPDTDATATIGRLDATETAPTTDTAYITGVTVFEGWTPPARFFDGSHPYTGPVFYWDGTANASASIVKELITEPSTATQIPIHPLAQPDDWPADLTLTDTDPDRSYYSITLAAPAPTTALEFATRGSSATAVTDDSSVTVTDVTAIELAGRRAENLTVTLIPEAVPQLGQHLLTVRGTPDSAPTAATIDDRPGLVRVLDGIDITFKGRTWRRRVGAYQLTITPDPNEDNGQRVRADLTLTT